MSDSDTLDSYRLTLERLVDERRTKASQLRKIDTAIETVCAFLPEDERHVYLNCLSDSGEGSRFKPETTLAEAAEMALRHFSEPMRVGAIVKMLREWRYHYEKDDAAMQNSLSVILARKAQRGETFVKVGAGLFGLSDWDGEPSDDEEDEAVAPRSENRSATRVTPIRGPQRAAPLAAPSMQAGKRVVNASPAPRTPQQGNSYDDFQAPPFEDDDDLPF